MLFATADDSALGDISQDLAPSFFISIAATPSDLLASIRQNNPEIIVLDETVIPDEGDLFEYVCQARAAAPEVLLIAISRRPLRKARQRTLEAGGDEFLLAPIDFDEFREYLLEGAEERRNRLQEKLREEVRNKNSFCGMIGGSDEIQRVYDAVRRVAKGTTTVMLRGESGTGKELLAHAIIALFDHAYDRSSA